MARSFPDELSGGQRQRVAGGAAAVLATHDAQLAAWADRVLFVRDGVAVDQSGPATGPESRLAADSAR